MRVHWTLRDESTGEEFFGTYQGGCRRPERRDSVTLAYKGPPIERENSRFQEYPSFGDGERRCRGRGSYHGPTLGSEAF